MIKRFIQLILDKNAAKRVEDDTRKSLDRGTDPRKPTDNLAKVEKSMARLRSVAVKVGAAMAGIWAVKKVFDFGKAVFGVGADVRAVGSQFRTVFGESGGRMQTWLNNFRRIAGLTNREAQKLSASAGSMAQGFGLGEDASADFAQQVLKLSGDLASFNNVPTAQAAQLVQSALIGNTEAARSLQVAFSAADVQARALADTGKQSASDLTQAEKALAALAVMTERAGPQIGDLARTQNDADNQAKQLAASFKQLKERMSAALVGGTDGTTVFGDLRDVFEDLTTWVDANSGAISAWSRVSIKAAVATAKSFISLVRIAFNAGQMIGRAMDVAANLMIGSFAEAFETIKAGANTLIEQANRLPGVEIDFRFSEREGPNVFFRTAREQADAFLGDVETIGTSVGAIGSSWRAVAEEIVRARSAARGGDPAAPSAPSSSPSPDGGPGGPTDEELQRNNERFLRRLDALHRAAEAAREFNEALMAEMEERASGTADAMVSAFQGYFEAVGQGFKGQQSILAATAEAARGVGAAIVAGLIEGRAEEQIAQGTAKLAAGTWPPNAAAFAAAGKHFAAAALFKAIPGVIRGGGSGGGGGGVGGSIPRGALATSVPGITDPIPPEINIYLDPLSPADERFQTVTLGAMQNAQERFGENVRVNVRPRSDGRA